MTDNVVHCFIFKAVLENLFSVSWIFLYFHFIFAHATPFFYPPPPSLSLARTPRHYLVLLKTFNGWGNGSPQWKSFCGHNCRQPLHKSRFSLLGWWNKNTVGAASNRQVAHLHDGRIWGNMWMLSLFRSGSQRKHTPSLMENTLHLLFLFEV